jgi:hypothetical protein
MRLVSDEQILSLEIRQQVIKEILGPENTQRKVDMLKRHEVYRDRTKKWVVDALRREALQPQTIELMTNRAGNVSVCRKIINKLARSYMGGVNREAPDEASTAAIEELVRLMDWNAKMKKADRYRQLFKNCMIQVIPEYESLGQTCLTQRVLAPWQYDVIESGLNPEEPQVVILSELYNAKTSAPIREGDGIDQTIADTPADDGIDQKHYIWWTDKYHFTTDEKGQILAARSPIDLLNPIQELPFANIAEDQDGHFWAQGGDDLIDGSVLINLLLTDMFAISRLQGYGQMVISGKNINENLTVGPHHAVILNQDVGDPDPKVYFASSNPPLDEWMKSIEQYVALMLSTNDLSPSSVSGSLSAQNFPSGIAMLIEQSEAQGNVEDKQRIFSDAEHELWEITQAWQNLYFDRKALSDEFMAVGKLNDANVTIKFNAAKPVVSEKEKLEALKLRKDLGINEMVDLILIDNPDMTRDQAEEKLKAIQEEKLNRMASAMGQAISAATQPKPQAPAAPVVDTSVDMPSDQAGGAVNA